MREDVGWSRNRDRLMQQLDKLQSSIQQIHLPAMRYSSKLLDRLPASTAVFASIPNLGQYLAEAQGVFSQNLSQSPELRDWWSSKGAGIEPVDREAARRQRVSGRRSGRRRPRRRRRTNRRPVFLAETKRDGFPEFLKKTIPGVMVETRPGLVVFGPKPPAVQALAASLDSPNPGFKGTPFYARIAEAYRGGAGMLLCADFARLPNDRLPAQGVRYFLAEQKEVRNQMELRATVAFQGERTGIAGWLASPASMGSLDYVTPEATFAGRLRGEGPARDCRSTGAGRRARARLGAGAAECRRSEERTGGQPGRRVLACPSTVPFSRRHGNS